MSTVLTALPEARDQESARNSTRCVFASKNEAAHSMAGHAKSACLIVLGAQPDAGCDALDSYLRPDWEYRLISSFDSAARTWHKRNGGEERFTVDGVDLADCGRFSFLTRVILEKGRTLAAVSDALEALSPAEVYCDPTFAPYLRVLYDGPLHVCIDAKPKYPADESFSLRRTKVLHELLLGLGYKLGCAMGLSRWLQWRKGDRLQNSAPLFVGSEHGLKNLEPFFDRSKRPVHVLRPVGQLRRNRGLANSSIDWRITYLESLLSVRDSVRVTTRAFRVARWFRKTYRRNGFRNLFQWNGRDCQSLFAPEFARFALAHSIGAFRNHYIAQKLIPHRPARVFFDNANAWEFSVMVEHLRHAKVPTIGFVNGLVQDIIPFRCAVDTLLTSGVWDQRLLQPVMHDRKVVAYGNPSHSTAAAERKNLLIVSSSCRDHENRRAFARVVAEYIEHGAQEFDDIVLKLHPYEDPDAMRRYFAEFPRAVQRIRITRHDLDAELSRARFAICLLSTVIRDLAWDGVPFLLFDSVEWPAHTFYSQIPDALKFASTAELAAKTADIDTLRADSLRVREIYFGEPSPDAFALLKLHLLGEGE